MKIALILLAALSLSETVESAPEKPLERKVLSKLEILPGISDHGADRASFEETTRVQMAWFDQRLLSTPKP